MALVSFLQVSGQWETSKRTLKKFSFLEYQHRIEGQKLTWRPPYIVYYYFSEGEVPIHLSEVRIISRISWKPGRLWCGQNMTVGDKAPQDAGHRSPDLEHLVQALAERVALLENKEEENPEVADEASSPVVIAEKEDESPPSVHGIIEKGHDYDEENISGRLGLIENRLDAYDDEKEMHLDDDNKYTLSESTFSLLITQHPLSVPFAFAVFSVTLSISCLSLTLASSINKGTKNNRLGIPAGVSGLTRAAQFFGE